MEKIDFNKGMGEIKKRVKKSGVKNEEKDNFKCQTINEKICPFMSALNADRECTSQCKLYRANKKGYECPFSELSCISYNLKNKN